MGFYLRCRRLQSGAAAQADSGGRLMAKVPGFAKAFAGRWRIVEMDNWDSDFLDLVEEAHLTFEGKSDGEIAFGALKVPPANEVLTRMLISGAKTHRSRSTL